MKNNILHRFRVEHYGTSLVRCGIFPRMKMPCNPTVNGERFECIALCVLLSLVPTLNDHLAIRLPWMMTTMGSTNGFDIAIVTRLQRATTPSVADSVRIHAGQQRGERGFGRTLQFPSERGGIMRVIIV